MRVVSCPTVGCCPAALQASTFSGVWGGSSDQVPSSTRVLRWKYPWRVLGPLETCKAVFAEAGVAVQEDPVSGVERCSGPRVNAVPLFLFETVPVDSAPSVAWLWFFYTPKKSVCIPWDLFMINRWMWLLAGNGRSWEVHLTHAPSQNP